MCGIVGHFSLLKKGMRLSDGKIMRELAIASTVRGYDGTGILMLDVVDNKLWYRKDTVVPSELCRKSEWETMLLDHRFAVVHTRSATIGEVDVNNTHPFLFKNLSGVHNGTIHAWRSAWHDTKADTDSFALFEALNEVSSDPKDVTDFLKKVPWGGAYALVWYDSRAEELRMVRNKERPLYIVTSDDGIWFGSELGMLKWILSRNSTKLYHSIALDPGKLLCLPCNGKDKASYHDYELGNTGSTYDTGFWHNGQSYGGYNEVNQQFGSFGNGATYVGNHYDITQLGLLPQSSKFNNIRNELYMGIHQFLEGGMNIDHTKFFDIKDALSKEVERRYSEEDKTLNDDYVCINKIMGNVQLAATIVEVDHPTMQLLGYVDMGDELKPVAIKCWSVKITKEVQEILSKGNAVITSLLDLNGIRLYHTGDIVPLMSSMCTVTEGELKVGQSLTTKEGKQIVKLYGKKNNPYSVSLKDRDADWDEGWGGWNANVL